MVYSKLQSQCTRVGSFLSDSRDLSSGVIHGSVIGAPYMFFILTKSSICLAVVLFAHSMLMM